ncbi:MAG: hypothetical protein AAF968_13270 [Pseudomonadota bacterium]
MGGLLLTGVSAISLAAMMIYSQWLDRQGVAPVAQCWLRFPLYVVVALVAVGFDIDTKGPVELQGLLIVMLIGFVVMALPVFAIPKAISLKSTLMLAAVTALGPLLVFLFQTVESRVDYAPATMHGLAIYFAGALLAAFGGARGSIRKAAKT